MKPIVMLAGLSCVALLAAGGCAPSAERATPKEVGRMQDWARAVLGGGRPPPASGSEWLVAGGPPISFRYGGRTSAAILPEWKRTTGSRNRPDGAEHVASWTDPATGLTVTVTAVAYTAFPAVDWVVHFENQGSKDTPILEDIQALDVGLATAGAEQPVLLHQIAGDDCSERTFLPMERTLASGQAVRFAPSGGRSSNGAFPYFTLSHGGRNLVTAIGWTGQWAVSIQRQEGRTNLRAGMELTHLVLHPGEKIRTPRIVLLESRGDPQGARNCFRRLLLAHYVPQRDGKPLPLPIASNCFDRYNRHPVWPTEAGQMAAAEYDKAVGVDTYWLDAAWFEGHFPNGVGNWFCKPTAFPRGLRPVSDLCHRLGLRVAVWFEPERVAGGTKIAREHPEFVHSPSPQPGGPSGLFRLDDPAARRWMTDLLSGLITEFGIDNYRNDFNIDPLPFWRASDAPDRQGMTEIRYVEGLYAMWDELAARHPGLRIDNCASGGRRLDLETCRRAATMTRSDTACQGGRAAWDQAQTFGLSFYFPTHCTMVWSPRAYEFRSGATGGTVIQYDYLGSPPPLALARASVKEVRENREYWFGDFHPLTACSIAADQWLAFQFHREDLGAGIVVAFRRPACESADLPVALRGLGREKRYAVEFVDENYASTSRVMTGEELMSKLVLTCPKKGSSLVVRYKAQK
jgi:alpha-galactosidase